MSSDCIFCQIVAREAPATIVAEDGFTLTIVPLNPVTEGHVIVVPRVHTPDATAAPGVTGAAMASACEYAKQVLVGSCNIITSVGAAATQSVWHLHVHVVPRRRDDGLLLPWGSNEAHMRRNDEMAYEFYNGSGMKDENG
jgi:histidine triad (HIT) family protein